MLFFNDFGGFADDEYVIKLKDGTESTPMPWSNVMSNPNFGTVVTETGGGFTWAENSRENRLTPWNNDIVGDRTEDIIYIRDETSGAVFTACKISGEGEVRRRGEYIIRHGFGYTVYEHTECDIELSQTVFVAQEASVKITILELENLSSEARKLNLYQYLRPVMGVCNEDCDRFLTFTEQNGGIFVKNSFNKEFPDRVMFAAASIPAADFTCDRREFFRTPLDGTTFSNRTGAGFDSCIARRFEAELKPNETAKIVFVMGQATSDSEAEELISHFANVENAERELFNVQQYWKSVLSAIEIETPNRAMDIMLNGWALYQSISCRIMGRSAFYQSGGAYGFRDQLQDVLSVLQILPNMAREQILLHAAHQFVEGDVQHWWHNVGENPSGKGDKGIRTKFSDDLLWLPYVTAEYIAVTGDFGILNEEIPFICGEILDEHTDEKYFVPDIANESANLYEHCIRALERTKLGERGLPLMGSGDWNDGMSTVGNKGKGESVWLGWFLIDISQKFAPIFQHMNDDEMSAKYEALAKTLMKNINENAWDGSWYRRAYFDDGTPMGSNINSECKIDSLSQSWAVISGNADVERNKTAMHNLEVNLINKEAGIVKLLTPAFNEGELEPGYIKSYVPGIRENGGQYTHAACWTAQAFAMMGNADTAMRVFDMLNPINHTRTGLEVATYKAEPYVMAADVYSVPPHVGRGGWSWYTGAAGWYYRVGIENILGIVKRADTLIINPCVTADWEEYSVKYTTAGGVIKLRIANPNRKTGLIEPYKINLREVWAGEIVIVLDK
ncbi:MAG: hypothetical protein FWE04_04265 [Oscillospiraceae bacterium]|nr:hypothetical protein [Oscillospiraceae bacterium]